ncbi:expressed unknown protein [Seminavis robusta]|uniref:Uncharacterized protein n=1 Tax=Seminavis robusta TaxID=568900 RepID=A0A9N8EXR1_9STRA|nr:expressed unknown protein [Seminavis robusta]|eukprot:Sro2378_g325390.1 n/a (205) ;mRNA; r:7503-8339
MSEAVIEGNPEFEKQLYGKADAVTCWDTIEHYVPAKYSQNQTMQDAIYTQLFRLIQKCLRPDSKVGRAWTSCLHYAPTKPSWKRSFNDYLLDKFHSGCYPDYTNRQLTQNAERASMKQILERNLTEDYYMTSVLSPEHFGRHKMKLTFYRFVVVSCGLCLIQLDPTLHCVNKKLCDVINLIQKKLEDSPIKLCGSVGRGAKEGN